MGSRASSALVVICCRPRHIGRKLGQRQKGQDPHQHSDAGVSAPSSSDTSAPQLRLQGLLLKGCAEKEPASGRAALASCLCLNKEPSDPGSPALGHPDLQVLSFLLTTRESAPPLQATWVGQRSPPKLESTAQVHGQSFHGGGATWAAQGRGVSDHPAVQLPERHIPYIHILTLPEFKLTRATKVPDGASPAGDTCTDPARVLTRGQASGSLAHPHRPHYIFGA